MKLKNIAVSVGDINGVGLELILRSHKQIVQFCNPFYCVHPQILKDAASLLEIQFDETMQFLIPDTPAVTIEKGKVTPHSGQYSFASFLRAIEACETQHSDALVTMPIHKEAWMLGGITYKGHTDYLRKHFDKEAIMMLGCEKMYVALFSEHIPLKDVALHVNYENIFRFLSDLDKELPKDEKIAVLGLNPHAGDNGVLGVEEFEINRAITDINSSLGYERFYGSVVPDVAFTPHFRKNFTYFVAMYHDQGLAPLKALYFDESVNISLNLPIVRTSVDHGTAFDIAYQSIASNISYINALKAAIELSSIKG